MGGCYPGGVQAVIASAWPLVAVGEFLPAGVHQVLVFEPVQATVGRWAGQPRSFHDRVAVQVLAAQVRGEQRREQVQQLPRDPFDTRHGALLYLYIQ